MLWTLQTLHVLLAERLKCLLIPFPSLSLLVCCVCCACVCAVCAELTVQVLQNKIHGMHLSTQLPKCPDKLLSPQQLFSLLTGPSMQWLGGKGKPLSWMTFSASTSMNGDKVLSHSTDLSSNKAAFFSTGIRINSC